MRIWLSRPHMSGRERDYVDQAFDSNFVAPLGPQLDKFEETVATYLGQNVHCVGLSSGSAALHLALINADVTVGDHVWVSSMTFAGGVFPIVYLGAIPIFIDLDPKSWTINCDILEEELIKANKENKLPKVIIPTDLYGQSVDLDRIESLCEKYGILLIIDSAESLGASYKNNRKCGTGGDIAILSFNGNKIITTSGGGMLVTSSKERSDHVRFLATQARDSAPHYQHSEVGYNYRMSNISAAIGLGQMTVLDKRVEQRRKINQTYKDALKNLGVTFLPEPYGYNSSNWLTAIVINPEKCGTNREIIRQNLLKKQIETRPLWKPMHLQPVFEDAKYYGRGFDEKIFERGLCLPSGSDLEDDEQQEVIEHIKLIISKAEI